MFWGCCIACGLEYRTLSDYYAHRYEHPRDSSPSPSWNDRVSLLPRVPRGAGRWVDDDNGPDAA